MKKTPYKDCATCKIALKNAQFPQELQSVASMVKKCINKLYYRYKVKRSIKCELEGKFEFSSIKCQQHYEELKTAILSAVINTCLQNFCTVVNRCLNGKYTTTTKNNILMSAQIKYRSKLKRKREQELGGTSTQHIYIIYKLHIYIIHKFMYKFA